MSNWDKSTWRSDITSLREKTALPRRPLSPKNFEAAGWNRTYIWVDLGNASPEAFAEAPVAELNGVREADVLVVLLPGGFGTHVEIGAALALGKPVILHSPDRQTLETPYPCIFHHHPAVKLMISQQIDVTEMVAAVSAMRGHLGEG